MNRHIVYPGQIPLDTDLLNAIQDAFYSGGWLALSAIGSNTAVVGLGVTPTVPASLQVNVGPGAIYSLQTVDGSAYGSLGTDANQIVKQGLAKASSTLTITPPAITGQSQNYLVQAAFSETDTSAVTLPYYNSSNPSVAWSGPNNSGTAQNTVRQDSCVISLKAGTPAATGSQTTPSPDAGYTGLYVVTVANGQTTITSGNIALLTTAPYFPTLPQIPSSIQNNTWVYATAGGTANAITATITPIPLSYTAGLTVDLKITATNTGAATLNLNGLGAVAITNNLSALVGGELPSGSIQSFSYDGTNFQITTSKGSGRLLNIQKFTASGTYTPTSGTTKIIVRAIGGGGGGAGSAANSSTTVCAGSGGAAGSWAVAQYTSGFSSVAVTIGSGGIGASASAGTSGGTTSFGALLSCPGGGGGPVLQLPTTNLPAAVPQSTPGGAPSGSGIIVSSAGHPGPCAVLLGSAYLVSGQGAPSQWGAGGLNTSSGIGGGATGFGSGGGGSATIQSAAAVTGGSGASGLVIVEEYA